MTTVLSNGALAQVKRLPLPGYTAQASTHYASAGHIPLLTGDGRNATYDAILRSQPWVYAVVTKLVYGLARLPLNAYEYVAGDDGGARARARGSDLDRLMVKPRARVSAFQFKQALAWDLMVYGNALVLKERPGLGSAPTALWNVPWRQVAVVQDGTEVLGYSLTPPSGGTAVAVDPGEVIHFTLPNAVSPLESLRRTLALEDAATTYQGQAFVNGVTPRGAFTSDQRLNESTLPRLRADLADLYAGPENAGRFGLFDQGLKWTQMGQSSVDAEVINQRKLSREEVCGAYDVSPPLVGILDRATFNNIELIHTALYVDTLGPKVTMIEQGFNAQLVDPEPSWDGAFVEFNLDDVLRPNPEARARTHMMTMQAGVTTVNERRRMENLPAIEDPDADTVMLPLNMEAVGEDDDADDPAAAPAGDPEGASLVDAFTASLDAARDAADTVSTGQEDPA